MEEKEFEMILESIKDLKKDFNDRFSEVKSDMGEKFKDQERIFEFQFNALEAQIEFRDEKTKEDLIELKTRINVVEENNKKGYEKHSNEIEILKNASIFKTARFVQKIKDNAIGAFMSLLLGGGLATLIVELINGGKK